MDKDGIINKLHYDTELGIIHTPLNQAQVEFVFGIFNLLIEAKKLGYLLIVVSNQPNIGIKKMSMEQFKSLTTYIKKELKKKGVTLDAEYYCFHHPFADVKKYRKDCFCRKPKTLSYAKAIKRFDIDPKKSWAIGDGLFDIIAGNAVGLKTILITNVNETVYLEEFEERLKGSPPKFIVKNLDQALEVIKSKK